MKPICVPCQRFFRLKKSGFYFIEGMPTAYQAAPGTSESEKWKPYKLWAGDLWECEGCCHQIISGFGQHPIAEHYEHDFAAQVEKLQASRFQVNDC